MRVNLNTEAEGALVRVHARFKETNPYVDAPNASFLGQFLQCLEKQITQEWVVGLAPQLTAPRLKRKVMRERLAKLADNIDDDALDKLERRIKKFESQAGNKDENGVNYAEK